MGFCAPKNAGPVGKLGFSNRTSIVPDPMVLQMFVPSGPSSAPDRTGSALSENDGATGRLRSSLVHASANAPSNSRRARTLLQAIIRGLLGVEAAPARNATTAGWGNQSSRGRELLGRARRT